MSSSKKVRNVPLAEILVDRYGKHMHSDISLENMPAHAAPENKAFLFVSELTCVLILSVFTMLCSPA